MSLVSAEHLADAYEAVARVNHYLVGIVGRDALEWADYEAAEQILIARQNSLRPSYPGKSQRFKRLDLALDILAYDRGRLCGRPA